jgi:hypothetical protein
MTTAPGHVTGGFLDPEWERRHGLKIIGRANARGCTSNSIL